MMILDMIYNVGSILKQFYKEPICSKYISNFSIMAILLIKGPRNTRPPKFKNQWCSFYYSYANLFIFLIFKYSKILYTQKKHAPILCNIKNQIC